MIQKIGQGKPWRWVVISAGVVLGGYLLISLLGAIIGLAFAAGTLLGGAWLFQRIWNQLKTRQIDETSNPLKNEDQNRCLIWVDVWSILGRFGGPKMVPKICPQIPQNSILGRPGPPRGPPGRPEAC